MKQAVQNLLERLLSGSKLTVEEILWLGLCVGLLFATVHLVTMLATRWGDRNITSKSLIFSVLLHVSCSLGLVAFHPPLEQVARLERPEDRIQIHDVLMQDEDEHPASQTGSTLVREQLLDPEKQEIARSERLPLEPEPAETPERHTEEPMTPDINVADVPVLPDEPIAIPRPEDRGYVGPRQETATPMKVNDETAEARPEVEIPRTATTRRTIARNGQVQSEARRRVPKRGSIDRPAREFDPSRMLASVDTPPDARAFLKRGREEDHVRRRQGPIPSTLPAEEAGMATPNQASPGAAGGTPAASPFVRRSSRIPRGIDNGAVERYRPERTPRLPGSRAKQAVAVLGGVPVDYPDGGPVPNVHSSNFDTVPDRKSVSVPSTYRLRSLARRKEVARKFGGTDASERAVEASLRWLALNQHNEGYWDAGRFGAGQVEIDENGVDRKRAGIEADAGLTALAVLAFLGAGYTHEEGQYADRIDRALRWLIRRQRSDGYLGGDATRYAQTYCHAMATYAMAEAYGMQSDPTIDTGLREPLRRAIAYSLGTQNPKDGGWRYVKGQVSDMSIFGWQLMALKSADIAGVRIPEEAKRRMIDFLKSRSLGPHGGLASYGGWDSRFSTQVTPSMTAEALFCKQMLGIERTNPASTEAVAYLMQNTPRRSELNLYYWYYGTLAMYQYGGDSWRKWNESVRDLLVAEQLQTGENAGSWDPRGPWGPYGGRLYSTTLSTLCLEVYYRFLPLYQMGGTYSDE